MLSYFHNLYFYFYSILYDFYHILLLSELWFLRKMQNTLDDSSNWKLGVDSNNFSLGSWYNQKKSWKLSTIGKLDGKGTRRQRNKHPGWLAKWLIKAKQQPWPKTDHFVIWWTLATYAYDMDMMVIIIETSKLCFSSPPQVIWC